MLAAIVITAAIGLIDVAAVRRLWRVRRSEFVLWLTAFAAVALLGVLLGIFVVLNVLKFSKVAIIFVCVYFAVCAAICVFFGDKLLAAGEKRLAAKGEN